MCRFRAQKRHVLILYMKDGLTWFLDSYNSHVPQHENHDFSFRANHQGPDFGKFADNQTSRRRNQDSYGSRSHGPPASNPIPRGPRSGGYNPREANNNRRRERRGGRGGFTRTHDRPLLTARSETTPERLRGMSEGTRRFKPLAEISDDNTSVASQFGSGSESDAEPFKKRVARGDDKPTGDDVKTVPKWSNPDPYTVLPPPDESKGKKKDVVKMIRKAKIAQDKTEENKQSVPEDFIAFDFGDDAPDSSSASSSTSGDDVVLLGEAPLHAVPNSATSTANFSPGPPYIPTGFGSLESRVSSAYSLDENIAPRNFDGPVSGKKRKRDAALDGSVRSPWLASNAQSAKPWYAVDRSDTQDIRACLHYEICDFYNYVKPQSFEADLRNDLVNRVSAVMQEKYGAQIKSFGSFASDLYLPTGDMDLVALSDVFLQRHRPNLGQTPRTIHKVADSIQKAGLMQPQSREVVARARVPLVKYVDSKTGLRVDVSFENVAGVNCIPTFQAWKRDYPAMTLLVYIIKQFLLMRGLNELYHGGMSSFTIVCLVVNLLHHHPTFQNGGASQLEYLGDLLLAFFDYYGTSFNARTTEIHLNPPRLEYKVCYPERLLLTHV